MNETLQNAATKADDFLSKQDFDFSTVSGWRDFLNERSAYGGRGREADGVQLRDFRNYNVSVANYMANNTIKGTIAISPLPGALQTPPGNLYVLTQDIGWNDKVEVYFIGTGFGTQMFSFDIGGPTPRGDEYWGAIYFIAIPSSDRIAAVPGVALLKHLNRGMAVLGVGYKVGVRIGSQPFTYNTVFPQRLFAPDGPGLHGN